MGRDPGGTDDLHARAAGGDREALAGLWCVHRRYVAAVLAAQGVRDLEDALQDVAVTLIDRIGELRDPGALRGWLREVAVNTGRARARRDRPAQELACEELAARAAPQDGDALASVLRRAERLPFELREPLLLRALGGLTQREVAEAIGLPETTVESRLARARRRLRELTSPEEQRVAND